MARKKGDGKGANGGGRPPGALNKKTREQRDFIALCVQSTQAEFFERLQKLDDAKYCEMWIKLNEFITPKLARQYVKVDAGNMSMQWNETRNYGSDGIEVTDTNKGNGTDN